jgi:hypothetical protein
METIKTTQNEQGFTSGKVECAVSIQKQHTQNLIQVTQEYKTDLLKVQEVRWLGRSTTEKKDCRIYNSCDDNIFVEQALLLVNAGDQEKLILSLLIGGHVCLELEVNLKIRASSVPMLQWRKTSEREKDEFMTD